MHAHKIHNPSFRSLGSGPAIHSAAYRRRKISFAPNSFLRWAPILALTLTIGGMILSTFSRAQSEMTGSFPIPNSPSTGVHKLLYLRVIFPNQLSEPISEKNVASNLKTLTDYYQENSYGKLTFLNTITPVLMMPRTFDWYKSDYKLNDPTGEAFPDVLMADAKEAARAHGYPPDYYQNFVLHFLGSLSSTWTGVAESGGTGVCITGSKVDMLEHEIGHNLGSKHAEFWNTNGASVAGPGQNLDYGSPNDVMGNFTNADGGHINVVLKQSIKWISADNYHTAAKSGTYRIYQIDQPNLDPALRYALKVSKDLSRSYFMEFRQKLNTNPWFANGVMFHWDVWGVDDNKSSTLGSFGGSQLLDITVGSPDDREDAPLTIGRTYSDYEEDVHITPISKGGTTPESMDVVVNLGTQVGNSAPTLAIGASKLVAAVGESINLTATAGDANGDMLAYFWDFGDKLADFNGSSFSTNNVAIQSKTFASAGYYLVRCTVSDMKGGATTKSLLITVGAPATFTLSGIVTQGGAPLANVRIHNGLKGLNGEDYRGAYTDSDGACTITNLSAANVTLSASLAGFTFTPAGFVNPVTVGPNQTGIDFTATAATRVSIEAVDASATEGGDTATLRLTRTGSTSSALTVYVEVSDNATGEYTFSPAAASVSTTSKSLKSFTIAAGSSARDVTLTASNDSKLDGTQVLQVALMNGNVAYLATGLTTVEITLIDNDLNTGGIVSPRVSMISDDAEAMENDPANTARFLVIRTGNTTAPLTVNFTTIVTPDENLASVSDYADLGGSVVIPAGSFSAPIIISPTNDSEMEGAEVLTLRLSISTNYVIDSQSLAKIKIIDDDIPTISLTASDTTANENGDTARFTFTRTGSTSAPFLVHYSTGGEATHGVDYLSLAGQLTFAAGSSFASVDIVPVQDSLGEPSESVSLQLRSATRYAIGGSGRASINIVDDADLPLVTINASTADAKEGPSPVTASFLITTNGTGSGNITVNYTLGGTAVNNVDFNLLSGNVTLGKNSTATITVTPKNDNVPEDVKTVVLTLQPSAIYSLDSKNNATLAIFDDDVTSFVSVSSNTNLLTEGGTGKFYFSRTGNTTSARTVSYAVSGTATSPDDFYSINNSVTIPAASTGVNVDVVSKLDERAEGMENVIVTILPDPIAPAGYAINAGTATMNIADVDGGFASTVQFSQTSSTVDEGTGSMMIEVTRTGGAAPCSVEYAVLGGTALGSGVDYTLAAGILNFADGVNTQSIAIAITDDALPENIETTMLQLRNATSAAIGTNQQTIQILDNEPRVTIEAIDPFADENGPDTATLRFTRNGNTSGSITVPILVSGTAISGVDYTALPGSVVIPAGSTAVNLILTPLMDAATEAPKSVIVSLASSSTSLSGTQTSATITIGDAQSDDPPFIVIVSPKGVAPGIVLGQNLWLDAAVVDDGAFTTTWSQLSGPGTVTFTDVTAQDTGAVFSAVGSYVLRLTASDGNATATTDVPIIVSATLTPWTNVDIGAVGLNGSASERFGMHSINGAGTTLTGTVDAFFLRHRTLNGDGELIARVLSVPATSSNARVGVMLRESNATNSPYAAMLLAPTTGYISSFNTRATPGATASKTTKSGITPAYWVRLVRSGNIFTAFDSPDATTWAQRGTQIIPMGTDLLAGIAVMSATNVMLNTALVDNVRIVGAAENSGAIVSAGTDASTMVNAALPLNGTATDDSLTPSAITTQWTQISGPAASTISNATSLTTTATLPFAGTYLFRLTTNDGDVQTYDDVTLTATTPSPIEQWRIAQFGAAANTPAAADGADPDFDGIVNLIEYALSLDPNSPDKPDMQSALNGTAFSMTYTRRLSATDISYTPEWSPDLSAWIHAGITEETLTNNGTLETIRASIMPGQGASRAYMRLRVTHNN